MFGITPKREEGLVHADMQPNHASKLYENYVCLIVLVEKILPRSRQLGLYVHKLQT